MSVFLLLALTEFRAFFAPEYKIPLVSAFVLIAVGSLAWWVIRPLLSYMKLGKRISHEQAAGIIGQHFPNVKDKLLNILQLKNDRSDLTSAALIEASIDQKSEEIKLVPFTKAVDLGKNRRYLRYALPPALVLLAIFLGSPNILRDSTQRLAKPAVHFEKAAPFSFLVDPPAKVIQYEDAQIDVKLEGSVMPAEVFIERNGKPFKMEAKQKDAFSYTFKNVSEPFEFKVQAEGFASVPYNVGIIPKPTLLDAQVELRYPAYTGKRPEVLKNVGELTMPAGTFATWKFNAKQTSDMAVDRSGKSTTMENENGFYTYASSIYKNETLRFFLSNDELANADSVAYRTNVIADQYPSITAEKISDSTDAAYMYFIGEYSDDYGISDLRFHFKLNHFDGNKTDSMGSERLQFERNASLGRFSHFTNADLFVLEPGDQLEYYFEVLDNDGVNGAKSARSRVFTYKKPTIQEFKDKEDENNEAIKDELAEAIDKVEDFSKEVQELKEDVLEKKALSWEEKKKLEDLMSQHDELQKALEQMQENFQENMQNQEEFKEIAPEILEKQERVQELMEELMTDEMKEMMDQLRQMMEEMEMDEMFQNLEDFEFSNEELENQLDRMLELFKKLEFEQAMQDMANELEELAEEQMELSEESKQEDANSDEILEQQEEINEKFEELKEDFSELEELNQEQQSPTNMDDLGDKTEEISEEMEKGTEQLEQQQPSKASPSQQKAGEKMKEMAQQMQGMMSNMMQMQATEDLEDLRQLLENLVKFSFDQEILFEEVKKTQTDQPKFRELVQQQYKLKDDAVMD